MHRPVSYLAEKFTTNMKLKGIKGIYIGEGAKNCARIKYQDNDETADEWEDEGDI